MDSGCPDCWGYNDSHPCLCGGRTDDALVSVDASNAVPEVPETGDPARAGA